MRLTHKLRKAAKHTAEGDLGRTRFERTLSSVTLVMSAIAGAITLWRLVKPKEGNTPEAPKVDPG